MNSKNFITRSLEIMLGTILGLTANQIYIALKPQIETKIIEPIKENVNESYDSIRKRIDILKNSPDSISSEKYSPESQTSLQARLKELSEDSLACASLRERFYLNIKYGTGGKK